MLPDVMSMEEAADASTVELNADGMSVSASSASRLLAFVDLAENAFEGYGFPDALVAAPELTYLYLENNALTGDLPLLTNGDPKDLEHKVRFRKTRVLSLSRNRFTGYVPDDHLLLDVFAAPPGAGSTKSAARTSHCSTSTTSPKTSSRVRSPRGSRCTASTTTSPRCWKTPRWRARCPTPCAIYIAETDRVSESEDDYVGGSASGRKDSGRRERGSGDGNIAAGIEDERAQLFVAAAAAGADAARASSGSGRWKSAAGAGACSWRCSRPILAHAAFCANLARQRRRALARDAFVDRLDDIGRRNARGTSRWRIGARGVREVTRGAGYLAAGPVDA